MPFGGLRVASVNAGERQQTEMTAKLGGKLEHAILQVTLKEKFIGTGSKNLSELEKAINDQAAKGYRACTPWRSKQPAVRGSVAETGCKQP